MSLGGRVYEVDTLLVGRNVILRCDPAAPPSRAIDVVHWPPSTGYRREPTTECEALLRVAFEGSESSEPAH